MKTVVVYASRKGFIKEASERLKKMLDGETDLIDLYRQNPGDLSSYDFIVLASSVRAGHYSARFRKLCNSQIPRLKDKKVVLLTGGLDEEGYEETVSRNISEENRKLLWKTVYGGGRYIPDQYNVIIRKIMEKIMKQGGAVYKERWENIDSLAGEIKGH